MAPSTSKLQDIQRLVQQGEDSRSLLSGHATLLRQRLDIPARLRTSLREKPSHWITGGLASGFVASFLLRRKAPRTKKPKNRSLPLALVGITFAAVRPLLQGWLTSQVKNYVAGKPTAFSAIAAHRSRDPSPPDPKNSANARAPSP